MEGEDSLGNQPPRCPRGRGPAPGSGMDGAGIVGECNVQEVREENPTLFYPNTAVPVRACPVWIQW